MEPNDFPVLGDGFPVFSPKFPVRLLRETRAKRPEYRDNQTMQTMRRPEFRKFPVFFPVSREFGAETGSPWTASSASQSRLHVELRDVGNVRDISGH